MLKSERLNVKLNKAEILIEQARALVLQVLDEDENGEGCTGCRVDKVFDDLVDFIGDVGYEVLMPMQLEEEEAERLAEISVLKARLAELGA